MTYDDLLDDRLERYEMEAAGEELRVRSEARTAFAQRLGLGGPPGMDESQADLMPHGAIRWAETHDKLGYLELTAISAPARAALEQYQRLQPRLGSAPLFPNLKREGEPISKIAADHLLRRAERVAGLPKFDRGLWHPYRRAWASERKHQPDVDTAKSGGWRDPSTMKQSYQQADAATMLKVIENSPPGHTSDTGAKRSADGTTT